MTTVQACGVLLIVTQTVLTAFGFADDSKVAQRAVVALFLIGLASSVAVGLWLILGAGQ